MEHLIGKLVSLLSHRHRRHPAFRQRAHFARCERGLAPRFSSGPHNYSIRTRRMRSGARLHYSGGRIRISPPPSLITFGAPPYTLVTSNSPSVPFPDFVPPGSLVLEQHLWAGGW